MRSSNNSFSLLIIFSLLLLLILDSADLTVLCTCPSKCGGIKIPYPFGIGKGCYLDKWYEIECIHTSNNPRKLVPLLSVISREVVYISLPSQPEYSGAVPYGSVRLKNQITSKGCSSHGEEELGSLLNLTGTPFFVSPRNTLIAVGCNNSASLMHIEPSVVGCKSSCGTTYHAPIIDYLSTVTCNSNKYCDLRSITGETSCDGIRCCKANMPDTIQQVVSVRIDNTTTRGGCKVAFLTDEAYVLSNGSDPQRLHAKGYATVELGWFIHTTNASNFVKSLGCYDSQAFRNLTTDKEVYRISCVCDYNSYLSYARCACNRGYEGNPYLRGGCTDINECLEPTQCHQGNCVNIPGAFHCVYTNHRQLAIVRGSWRKLPKILA